MIQNTIINYVRTMFDESREGELTAGDLDNQFEYPVEWDEATSEDLAQQCGTLIDHLTQLSGQYERLKTDTRHLTQAQLDVWNTYLRPFPKHNLDNAVLEEIWNKMAADMELSDEEWDLANAYVEWFEQHALTRLPVKRCSPAQMINRAKYYCKLIQLNAPAVVLENQAKRFSEEFVLYHCMNPNNL